MAASNNASIDWTSSDAAVIRSMEKMERNLDAMARKMEGVERASQKAAKTSETGFEKGIASIGRMSMAIVGSGGIMTAFNMWSQANQKLLEEAQEVGKAYDDMFRKFRVQSGLNAVETDKQRLRIMDVAHKNATEVEVATAAATALVGADVPIEQATGNVLDVILRGIAAARVNGDPLDPADVSTAITSYLKSQGTELTPENIAERVVAAQQIIGRSDFKMGDFAELTKVASGLKDYISPELQLAAFSTLITEGAKSAPESATNLRNVTARLTTARMYPAQIKALESMGLTPEQVDLVGEDLPQVLDLFAERLQTLPAEERAGNLAKMFEVAGVSGFMDLMNNRQKIRERVGQQGNVADFNRLARIGLSGREAAATRFRINKERGLLEADYADDLIVDALRERDRDLGKSAFQADVNAKAYQWLRYAGFSPATTLGGGSSQFDRENYVDVLNRVDREAGGETGAKQLDALLEETRLMRQNAEQNFQQPRVRPPAAANNNGGGIR